MAKVKTAPRMIVVGHLREDHERLRKKAALLSAILPTAAYAPQLIRQRTSALLRTLNRHMERESTVFTHSTGDKAGHPEDHSTEHALLRTAFESFEAGIRISTSNLVLHLAQALERLEHRMDTQERKVFTLLEASGEPERPPCVPRHAHVEPLTATMSMNAILRRHPQTASVFHELQIDRWREGYESLDELAWRCGLDSSQVLKRLQAIAEVFSPSPPHVKRRRTAMDPGRLAPGSVGPSSSN